MPYLCTRNTTTGCSAVRLAHLVWDQRVPGSNPGIPTERDEKSSLFFCRDTRIRLLLSIAPCRFIDKKENYSLFLLRNEKTFVIFVLHKTYNLKLKYERKS